MRLIDADALIEDLEYDVELDARALDDTDLLLGTNRELVQFDKDCKQNAVDILKKALTADKGYKCGLEDAWEVARKACLYSSSKDDMDWIDERRECFGKTDTYDILHMTVYEAKAKYDAWIDKQEEKKWN